MKTLFYIMITLYVNIAIVYGFVLDCLDMYLTIIV